MVPNEIALVAVKTPMMPRPTTAMLPVALTVEQALAQIRSIPPKDANARRVLQQLELETSRSFNFLAIGESGEINEVKGSTALHKISFLREVRTERGLEKIPTVAFEVQAYAPVGKGVWIDPTATFRPSPAA